MILLLCSCSNEDLSNMENPPYSIPIYMPKNGNQGVALDQDNNVWQWSINRKRFEETKYIIEKIDIEDVHSIGVGMGQYAIKNNGELWYWDSDNPSNLVEIKLEKPIKKYISFGDFNLLLFKDGTLLHYPFKPKICIGHCDISTFPELRDAVIGGKYGEVFILGLSHDGKVYMAGGFRNGDNSEIIPNRNDFITNATIIENLPVIRRIGTIIHSAFVFAIDESDNVYYWNGGMDSKGIQKLDQKATVIHRDRLITPEGKVISIRQPELNTKNPKLELDVRKLPMPDAYCLWMYEISNGYSIGVDRDGNVISGRRMWTTPNFKSNDKITGFKVNLDYFK